MRKSAIYLGCTEVAEAGKCRPNCISNQILGCKDLIGKVVEVEEDETSGSYEIWVDDHFYFYEPAKNLRFLTPLEELAEGSGI